MKNTFHFALFFECGIIRQFISCSPKLNERLKKQRIKFRVQLPRSKYFGCILHQMIFWIQQTVEFIWSKRTPVKKQSGVSLAFSKI